MKIERNCLYNKKEMALPEGLVLTWQNAADIAREYGIDSMNYCRSLNRWTAYKDVYDKTIGHTIHFDQSDEIYGLVNAYNFVFRNKTEEDYHKGFCLDSIDGYEEADKKLKSFVRKKCKIDKDVKIFFGTDGNKSLHVRLNS